MRPRNSQARLLLTGGLPRLPTSSRPVQGQAEGLDWAIWGEPSESGLPSWDTVTITHEVRSQEGSSAWHRSTGCPGNDKTPVLQF